MSLQTLLVDTSTQLILLIIDAVIFILSCFSHNFSTLSSFLFYLSCITYYPICIASLLSLVSLLPTPFASYTPPLLIALIGLHTRLFQRVTRTHDLTRAVKREGYDPNAPRHIVILNGSPRPRGNTKKLITSFITRVKESAPHPDSYTFSVIEVGQQRISNCVGCMTCITKGRKCRLPSHEKVEAIKEALVSADAFVLTSPVYVGHISGPMKSFLDRCADWWHRPPLHGKAFYCLSTTAGAFGRRVNKELAEQGRLWGATYSGSYSLTGPAIENRVAAEEELMPITNSLKTFLRAVRSPTSSWRPSYRDLLMYRVMSLTTLFSLLDLHHWNGRGWMRGLKPSSGYFMPCRIGLFKRAVMAVLIRVMYMGVPKTNVVSWIPKEVVATPTDVDMGDRALSVIPEIEDL